MGSDGSPTLRLQGTQLLRAARWKKGLCRFFEWSPYHCTCDLPAYSGQIPHLRGEMYSL